MIRWRAPSYDGDRRLALSGRVEIGAVFPPHPGGGHWRWRLFVGGGAAALSFAGINGEARTELAAKNALAWAWGDFLIRADLREWSQASAAAENPTIRTGA